MVKLDKIYTRGGDEGKTSLTGGRRVYKHDLRVQAYGAVDEANAAIGIVRLHTPAEDEADRMLEKIQHDLFDAGADLSTPHDAPKTEGALRITESQVERLEQEIDAMNAELPELKSFVLPGGEPAAAYLHHARAAVRRAERFITRLAREEEVNPQVLQYINRLSDHLFVLGRYLNDQGRKDVLWKPGVNR